MTDPETKRRIFEAFRKTGCSIPILCASIFPDDFPVTGNGQRRSDNGVVTHQVGDVVGEISVDVSSVELELRRPRNPEKKLRERAEARNQANV